MLGLFGGPAGGLGGVGLALDAGLRGGGARGALAFVDVGGAADQEGADTGDEREQGGCAQVVHPEVLESKLRERRQRAVGAQPEGVGDGGERPEQDEAGRDGNGEQHPCGRSASAAWGGDAVQRWSWVVLRGGAHAAFVDDAGRHRGQDWRGVEVRVLCPTEAGCPLPPQAGVEVLPKAFESIVFL
ncbi:MAG: hypothetical protein QM739_00010 [Propionivibrio sp.]